MTPCESPLRSAHAASVVVWLGVCAALASCTRPAPPGDDALGLPGVLASDVGEGDDVGASDANAVADSSVGDGAQHDAAAAPSSDTVAAGDSGRSYVPVDGGGTCTPGAQFCLGNQLATCGSAGDGYLLTSCFPGQYCDVDSCVAIENNLIIVFDTSGSMNTHVPGVPCQQAGFPSCDPTQGCSRMDVSKSLFLKALDQVDPNTNRVALLRFPQTLARLKPAGCAAGHYAGMPKLSTDPGNVDHVGPSDAWFWGAIHEILCVPFPLNLALTLQAKLDVAQWMDGQESIASANKACTDKGPTCLPSASCAPGECCGDACCGGACQEHVKPELRGHGGTPIGRTLFYVGAYLRHRVLVDGRPCSSNAGCINPNYRCEQGACVDKARHCRETVVVLFTDGGEVNDPTQFFAPRTAAKRLAFGLACTDHDGCVGGATCQGGRCLPASPTGYHCVATGKACGPAGSGAPCLDAKGAASPCLPDLLQTTSAAATNPLDNVLRSPDGRPFGVRVNVVDISDNPDVTLSYYLARAGNGRLFTASSSDPLVFISALHNAFDMKSKKVCGSVQ